MVRIDRVITRSGDNGETSLGDGTRTPKDALRVETFGTVDEANAAVGLARLYCREDPIADGMLAQIQNDLFDIGADLCVPGTAGDRLRVTAATAERLEKQVEAMNEHLLPLDSFILPGGAPAAAHAHMARTIIRRAERRAVRLSREEPVNPHLLRALNRLSDHLFVLARRINQSVGPGEVRWVPGGHK